MRLGQIARKLDTTTKKVVKFLKENDIVIEDSLNTKLDDNQVELVTKQFEKVVEEIPVEVTPEPVQEVEKEEPKEKVAEETLPEEELVSESKEVEEVYEVITDLAEATDDTMHTEITETLTPNAPVNNEAVEESTELTVDDKEGLTETPVSNVTEVLDENSKYQGDVIRAEKITLEGIKVVGKIDLPEKPKPEVEETEVTSSSDVKGEEQVIQETKETVDEQGPYVHPSKREMIRKEEDDESIAITKSTKKKKEHLKRENVEAPTNKKKQKTKKKIEPAPKRKKETEEAIKKNALREKRQRQRDKEKEIANKPEKSFLKKLWDSMW